MEADLRKAPRQPNAVSVEGEVSLSLTLAIRRSAQNVMELVLSSDTLARTVMARVSSTPLLMKISRFQQELMRILKSGMKVKVMHHECIKARMVIFL